MNFFRLLRFVVVTISLALLLLPSLPVSALPDLTGEVSKSVDIQKKELFFAYFRYGNPTATAEMVNLTVTLELTGQGVEIVPTEMYDLYAAITTEQAVPQIPTCDNSYNGFDYKISPSLLLEGKKLSYGPQSSTVLLQASGSEISSLPARSAGCLRIGLKVSESAQIGQQAQLVFNPDSRQANPEVSIGKQSLNLTIGEGDDCEISQEAVQGKCKPTCLNGQTRNKEGNCQSLSDICQEGREVFEGKCVPICNFGENRDSIGQCIPFAGGFLGILNQIWTVPLILALVIALWFGGQAGWKKLKKISGR